MVTDSLNTCTKYETLNYIVNFPFVTREVEPVTIPIIRRERGKKKETKDRGWW